MSRKKPAAEYQKTFAFRFFRWLSGSKDPYLGEVEMQPQKEFQPDPEAALRHEKEHDAILDKVYDSERNMEMKLFRKLYHGTSILFCLFLIALLLVTISWLPATGTVNRPVNNEVTERYIEKGLEETGAVNIVAGMILDYRAFDTLGESHVLFVATITVLILLRLNKTEKRRNFAACGNLPCTDYYYFRHLYYLKRPSGPRRRLFRRRGDRRGTGALSECFWLQKNRAVFHGENL